MKVKIPLCILLLVLWQCQPLHAQTTSTGYCLQNPGFGQFCGTDNDYCSFYTSASYPNAPAACSPQSVVNWLSSHGSPQIKNWSAATPSAAVAYIWSSYDQNQGFTIGEGIFANFQFTAGVTYTFSMNLATYYSAATSPQGQVVVWAANDIQEDYTSGAGGREIPESVYTDKQQIASLADNNASYHNTTSITFTPTKNYSQLWIYPSTPGRIQYNVSIDSVSLCQTCNNTTTSYTLANSIPGGYTYSEVIQAGSSLGAVPSGTVNLSAGTHATFVANDYVDLVNNVDFAPDNTSSFDAYIAECGTLYTSARVAMDGHRKKLYSLKDAEKLSTLLDSSVVKDKIRPINLYPNPASDWLILQNLPVTGETRVIITDLAGRTCKSLVFGTSAGQHKVDIHDLPNGAYLMNIYAESRVYRHRFVKLK